MVVRDEHGLGHESAGVVIKLGPGVTTVKEGTNPSHATCELFVGDRVAIEPGIPCSKPACYFCRTGRYNACPDVKFYSTPPYAGTLTRYHAHPAAWLHRLPDNISFEEGALLEPLSVALAAVTRAKLSLGMSTMICGAGPIGLVTLLCAAAAGCEPLVISDLDHGRLEWAKGLVPRVHPVHVSRDDSPQDIAAKVKSVAGEEGISCALECTGVESSVSSAIYVSPWQLVLIVVRQIRGIGVRGWGREGISEYPLHASFGQ
jgi:L-iditol 2-dehydrogenase